MSERTPGQVRGAEPRANALIQPASAEQNLEHDEEEPRGSLVLLLLFLAAMVGVWLYVYFLLIERV